MSCTHRPHVGDIADSLKIRENSLHLRDEILCEHDLGGLFREEVRYRPPDLRILQGPRPAFANGARGHDAEPGPRPLG